VKVYISSTYQDLVAHRAAVDKTLRRMGHDVIGMEQALPRVASSWTAARRMCAGQTCEATQQRTPPPGPIRQCKPSGTCQKEARVPCPVLPIAVRSEVSQ
jgi:hypothetical protein